MPLQPLPSDASHRPARSQQQRATPTSPKAADRSRNLAGSAVRTGKNAAPHIRTDDVTSAEPAIMSPTNGRRAQGAKQVAALRRPATAQPNKDTSPVMSPVGRPTLTPLPKAAAPKLQGETASSFASENFQRRKASIKPPTIVTPSSKRKNIAMARLAANDSRAEDDAFVRSPSNGRNGSSFHQNAGKLVSSAESSEHEGPYSPKSQVSSPMSPSRSLSTSPIVAASGRVGLQDHGFEEDDTPAFTRAASSSKSTARLSSPVNSTGQDTVVYKAMNRSLDMRADRQRRHSKVNWTPVGADVDAVNVAQCLLASHKMVFKPDKKSLQKDSNVRRTRSVEEEGLEYDAHEDRYFNEDELSDDMEGYEIGQSQFSKPLPPNQALRRPSSVAERRTSSMSGQAASNIEPLYPPITNENRRRSIQPDRLSSGNTQITNLSMQSQIRSPVRSPITSPVQASRSDPRMDSQSMREEQTIPQSAPFERLQSLPEHSSHHPAALLPLEPPELMKLVSDKRLAPLAPLPSETKDTQSTGSSLSSSSTQPQEYSTNDQTTISARYNSQDLDGLQSASQFSSTTSNDSSYFVEKLTNVVESQSAESVGSSETEEDGPDCEADASSDKVSTQKKGPVTTGRRRLSAVELPEMEEHLERAPQRGRSLSIKHGGRIDLPPQEKGFEQISSSSQQAGAHEGSSSAGLHSTRHPEANARRRSIASLSPERGGQIDPKRARAGMLGVAHSGSQGGSAIHRHLRPPSPEAQAGTADKTSPFSASTGRSLSAEGVSPTYSASIGRRHSTAVSPTFSGSGLGSASSTRANPRMESPIVSPTASSTSMERRVPSNQSSVSPTNAGSTNRRASTVEGLSPTFSGSANRRMSTIDNDTQNLSPTFASSAKRRMSSVDTTGTTPHGFSATMGVMNTTSSVTASVRVSIEEDFNKEKARKAMMSSQHGATTGVVSFESEVERKPVDSFRRDRRMSIAVDTKKMQQMRQRSKSIAANGGSDDLLGQFRAAAENPADFLGLPANPDPGSNRGSPSQSPVSSPRRSVSSPRRSESSPRNQRTVRTMSLYAAPSASSSPLATPFGRTQSLSTGQDSPLGSVRGFGLEDPDFIEEERSFDDDESPDEYGSFGRSRSGSPMPRGAHGSRSPSPSRRRRGPGEKKRRKSEYNRDKISKRDIHWRKVGEVLKEMKESEIDSVAALRKFMSRFTAEPMIHDQALVGLEKALGEDDVNSPRTTHRRRTNLENTNEKSSAKPQNSDEEPAEVLETEGSFSRVTSAVSVASTMDDSKSNAGDNESRTKSRTEHFFERILPDIISRAAKITTYFPRGHIPVLRSDRADQMNLSRIQVASVVANMFLCAMPNNEVSFANLLCSQQTYQVAKLKFFVQYFDRLSQLESLDQPEGFIQIIKNIPSASFDWVQSNTPLYPLTVKYGNLEDETGALQIVQSHDNLGGGLLYRGRGAEEVRFCQYPELLVAMFVCNKLKASDSVIIKGAEKFSNFSGLDGFTLKFAGNFVDTSPRAPDGSLKSAVVFLDPIQYLKTQPLGDQMVKQDMVRELTKVLSGLTPIPETEGFVEAATAKWGCDHLYSGNPEVHHQEFTYCSLDFGPHHSLNSAERTLLHQQNRCR